MQGNNQVITIYYKKMKISTKWISWIIIIILGVIIFFMRSCQHCPECPEPTTTTVTVNHYDTIVRIVYVNKPEPYQVIIPGPTIIDSAKCQLLYRLYNSKNIYLDTLLNDTSAFISIRDTVFQNKLGFRKLYFVNKRPTMTETTITNVYGDTLRRRNKIFIGLLLGRSLTEFTTGVSLMLVTKKDAAYSLNFDPVFRNVYGSIYFKIKLRRK